MVYRVVVSLLDTSGTQAAVVYIKYVSTSQLMQQTPVPLTPNLRVFEEC